jgi:[ribosomal protein S5]-alanine N-acetyltransferase
MVSVRLLPIDAGLAAALGSFEASYGLRLNDSALVGGVVGQVLGMGSSAPWGGYLAADPATEAVVGTCAFKGAPDERGAVEIAYYTFAPFEGRGYAGAMVQALLGVAAATPEVRQVVAHTMPEANASTRVLERAGFRFAGEVEDPEDGPVWRWERLPTDE